MEVRMVSFTPQMPYSQGKCLQFPMKEGWVDPRVDLDVVEKRKSFLCWGVKPQQTSP
jgi:hypothetical protein